LFDKPSIWEPPRSQEGTKSADLQRNRSDRYGATSCASLSIQTEPQRTVRGETFVTEIRVVSAAGQIGSGFLESSFARGISLEPHVIACDGGSTDAGPYHLGSGKPHFSRQGVD